MVSLALFFFFNDPATTEIYTVYNTLSLHDALPISCAAGRCCWSTCPATAARRPWRSEEHTSELQSLYTISYAVFCLKKKKPDVRVRAPMSSARILHPFITRP